MAEFYGDDLAYVHDAGFTEYAGKAAPEIVRLLRGRRMRGGLVVEFGCGSGVVAERVTKAGFDVLGIDVSPAMIRLARRRSPAAIFRVGSLAHARIPQCRAIVALGEVLTYLGDGGSRQHRRDLARFFARARRALDVGGVLLFDFLESAAGRTYAPKCITGRDWAIDVEARAGAAGRTITRRMTVHRLVAGEWRHSREVHRVRIYRRDEMRALVEAAGFAVVARRTIGRVRLMRGDVAVMATAR
jgi:SAM-dependent methyltransferase